MLRPDVQHVHSTTPTAAGFLSNHQIWVENCNCIPCLMEKEDDISLQLTTHQMQSLKLQFITSALNQSQSHKEPDCGSLALMIHAAAAAAAITSILLVL